MIYYPISNKMMLVRRDFDTLLEFVYQLTMFSLLLHSSVGFRVNCTMICTVPQIPGLFRSSEAIAGLSMVTFTGLLLVFSIFLQNLSALKKSVLFSSSNTSNVLECRFSISANLNIMTFLLTSYIAVTHSELQLNPS